MNLERLQRVALAIYPWRHLFWLGVTLCTVLFFYAVLEPASGNRIAQPAYLAGIWLALVLSFVYGFRQVPPTVTKPWWRRWLRNVHRGGYWLLATLTLVATLGLVSLSVRLLLQVGTT